VCWCKDGGVADIADNEKKAVSDWLAT
jgi:hypothetical protein